MKILKQGFTLSEILVTLGIIGVVAAITVPSIMNNSISRTIAPSLAQTVHDLEGGFENIIQAVSDKIEDDNAANNMLTSIGVQTLDLIRISDIIPSNNDNTHIITMNTLFRDLRGAIGAVEVEASERTYLANAKLFSGNNLIKGNNKYSFINNGNVFKFPKRNALFVFEPTTDSLLDKYAKAHSNNIDGDVVIARIMIDANGSDGPNRFGRDIFLFGIANNGKLVPAGSPAYNNNIFAKNLQENLYTDANECSGANNLGNGASCAARVVIDGWKINYDK